jgi:hypothetical protein
MLFSQAHLMTGGAVRIPLQSNNTVESFNFCFAFLEEETELHKWDEKGFFF